MGLRCRHFPEPDRIIGAPIEEAVIDLAAVTQEVIESATEAETMIVRIDDIVAAE
jgi:chaperonin GroEL (HSP60 family)